MNLRLKRLGLGLSCLALLASCSQAINGGQALEIGKKWNVDSANAITAYKTVTKDPSGAYATKEEKDPTIAKAFASSRILYNVAFVSIAYGLENAGVKVTWASIGAGLGVYYSQAGTSYASEIDGEGLPTYFKVAYADGKATETWYTWYR